MIYLLVFLTQNPNYKTITTKPGANVECTTLGQRKGFSDVDIAKIRALYECDKSDKETTVVTTTVKPVTGTAGGTDCKDTNK